MSFGDAELRSIIDHLLEGCQILGWDWTYLYVNDTVARHGRKTKQELLGRKMMDVYPGIETTPMFEVLRRCMETGTSDHLLNEFLFDDGSTRWFQLSVMAVPQGMEHHRRQPAGRSGAAPVPAHVVGRHRSTLDGGEHQRILVMLPLP